MWYRLNQILFVLLVGGASIWALVAFIKAPPVLRREGQEENQLQKQAKKDLQKHLQKIHGEQAEMFQRAMEQGRSATGS
jgi:hypothetical protein